MLSLRSDSRRRKLTVGIERDSAVGLTNLACGEGEGGAPSSRGIESDTVVPRSSDRDDVVSAAPLAGRDSERDKFSSDAEACSVHEEIAIVCCGDRFPCEA